MGVSLKKGGFPGKAATHGKAVFLGKAVSLEKPASLGKGASGAAPAPASGPARPADGLAALPGGTGGAPATLPRPAVPAEGPAPSVSPAQAGGPSAKPSPPTDEPTGPGASAATEDRPGDLPAVPPASPLFSLSPSASPLFPLPPSAVPPSRPPSSPFSPPAKPTAASPPVPTGPGMAAGPGPVAVLARLVKKALAVALALIIIFSLLAWVDLALTKGVVGVALCELIWPPPPPPPPPVSHYHGPPSGGSGVGPGQDGSGWAELAGLPYRMPSHAPPGTALDVPELRWCLRQLVRSDMLLFFAPDEADPGPAMEGLRLLSGLCGERGEPSDGEKAEAYGPGNSFGPAVVKETLAEIRITNPTLAMRTPLPPGSMPAGFTADPVPVLEAQSILDFLGFDPGPRDGRAGPRTAGALLAFQRTLGIPADGRLDRRTGALLRNAAFNFGVAPVDFTPAGERPQEGRRP